MWGRRLLVEPSFLTYISQLAYLCELGPLKQSLVREKHLGLGGVLLLSTGPATIQLNSIHPSAAQQFPQIPIFSQENILWDLPLKG